MRTDHVTDKGLKGYQRYVGLGVLAYHLHRLGQARLARRRTAQARQAKPDPEAALLARYEQAMAA